MCILRGGAALSLISSQDDETASLTSKRLTRARNLGGKSVHEPVLHKTSHLEDSGLQSFIAAAHSANVGGCRGDLTTRYTRLNSDSMQPSVKFC